MCTKHVLNILGICLLILSVEGSTNRPRGLRPELITFYNPKTSDGLFQCLDGSVTIKYLQVNDDYCDCPVRISKIDSSSIDPISYKYTRSVEIFINNYYLLHWLGWLRWAWHIGMFKWKILLPEQRIQAKNSAIVSSKRWNLWLLWWFGWMGRAAFSVRRCCSWFWLRQRMYGNGKRRKRRAWKTGQSYRRRCKNEEWDDTT